MTRHRDSTVNQHDASCWLITTSHNDASWESIMISRDGASWWTTIWPWKDSFNVFMAVLPWVPWIDATHLSMAPVACLPADNVEMGFATAKASSRKPAKCTSPHTTACHLAKQTNRHTVRGCPLWLPTFQSVQRTVNLDASCQLHSALIIWD